MPRRPSILRRLDAALGRMADRDMEVRAIYLTETDWDAFNKAQSRAYGSRCVCFAYGDHQIRSGKTTMIYSKQGVGVTVPKVAP